MRARAHHQSNVLLCSSVCVRWLNVRSVFDCITNAEYSKVLNFSVHDEQSLQQHVETAANQPELDKENCCQQKEADELILRAHVEEQTCAVAVCVRNLCDTVNCLNGARWNNY